MKYAQNVYYFIAEIRKFGNISWTQSRALNCIIYPALYKTFQSHKF